MQSKSQSFPIRTSNLLICAIQFFDSTDALGKLISISKTNRRKAFPDSQINTASRLQGIETAAFRSFKAMKKLRFFPFGIGNLNQLRASKLDNRYLLVFRTDEDWKAPRIQRLESRKSFSFSLAPLKPPARIWKLGRGWRKKFFFVGLTAFSRRFYVHLCSRTGFVKDILCSVHCLLHIVGKPHCSFFILASVWTLFLSASVNLLLPSLNHSFFHSFTLVHSGKFSKLKLGHTYHRWE